MARSAESNRLYVKIICFVFLASLRIPASPWTLSLRAFRDSHRYLGWKVTPGLPWPCLRGFAPRRGIEPRCRPNAAPARRKHPHSGLREVPRASVRRDKTRAAAGLASKTEGRPCSLHQTAAGGRPDSVLAAEQGCKVLAPVSSSWPPPADCPSCLRAAGCWRPRPPW